MGWEKGAELLRATWIFASMIDGMASDAMRTRARSTLKVSTLCLF